jgi:hypothetical protein
MLTADAYTRRVQSILRMAGVNAECTTKLAGKREAGHAATSTVRPATPHTLADVQSALREARGDYLDMGDYRVRSGAVVLTWLRPGGRRDWVKK